MAGILTKRDGLPVDKPQANVKIPIGKTVKLIFEMDDLRAQCSKAAREMLSRNPMDGNEFEECARLDDALAEAHALLKARLRGIMISRISRRSRAPKGK
jgi:hypothetical protein